MRKDGAVGRLRREALREGRAQRMRRKDAGARKSARVARELAYAIVCKQYLMIPRHLSCNSIE